MIDNNSMRTLGPQYHGDEDVTALRGVRRAAVITICTNALDATDAAQLLAVLGLDPREGRDDLADDVELRLRGNMALPNFNEVKAFRRG